MLLLDIFEPLNIFGVLFQGVNYKLHLEITVIIKNKIEKMYSCVTNENNETF